MRPFLRVRCVVSHYSFVLPLLCSLPLLLSPPAWVLSFIQRACELSPAQESCPVQSRVVKFTLHCMRCGCRSMSSPSEALSSTSLLLCGREALYNARALHHYKHYSTLTPHLKVNPPRLQEKFLRSPHNARSALCWGGRRQGKPPLHRGGDSPFSVPPT